LAADAPAPPDPVLAAMRDEIARSGKLTVSNLDAPYFIQYVIDEGDSFSVAASLGGLLARRRDHIRQPEVTVRVGDYKFDNTNFAGRVGGTRYDLGRWPLDDSYPVLRRYFWLATDSVYKSAVETISRKRAARRNLTESSPADDFSHAPKMEYIHELSRLAIDENDWAARVRSLSAIFTDYPAVLDSRVDLEAEAGGYYVVNSEGTAVRAAENAASLRVRAVAQAADGMMLRDAIDFLALDPRVVVVPVAADQVAALGAKVYKIAGDPFKFPEAVLISADGKGYGTVGFKLDPDHPGYVQVDNRLFKRIFGDFAPSRGDLVFSQTGELLGIMVNSDYCALLGNFTAAAEITTGDDISALQTGRTIDALSARIRAMPLALQ